MSFKTLSQSVLGLCNRILGESISYTPNGGSPVSIDAVFDNAYVDIDGVMSMKPILRVSLSDLQSAPAKGDLTTINLVNYKVMESRPDSYGGSLLILQKT